MEIYLPKEEIVKIVIAQLKEDYETHDVTLLNSDNEGVEFRIG